MSRADDAIMHLNWAREAEKRGDYVMARIEYMKCVESWKQASIDGSCEKEFQAATREYHDFVMRDPLYNSLLKQILPIISSNPGILQKDIYDRLPAIKREDISYVLYFADFQGKIKRIKKGRTYELYVS